MRKQSSTNCTRNSINYGNIHLENLTASEITLQWQTKSFLGITEVLKGVDKVLRLLFASALSQHW